MTEHEPLPGAKLLRQYLEARDLSATAFCREHGLDTSYVGRVLRGDARRVTANFAHDIYGATDGAIGYEAWAMPEPMRRAERRRLREARQGAE